MARVDDINILIIGHGEHGKSEVTEILEKGLGYTTGESSYVCGELVFEKMRSDYNIHYTTPQECWSDRRNHRDLWRKIIHQYNTPDLTKLTRLIYEGNNIYTGLRDPDEFIAGYRADIFDIIIYVDATERVGISNPNDVPMPIGIADIIISNNDSLSTLRFKVDRIKNFILDIYLPNKKAILSKRGTWDIASRYLNGKLASLSIQTPTTEQKLEAIEWIIAGTKIPYNINVVD